MQGRSCDLGCVRGAACETGVEGLRGNRTGKRHPTPTTQTAGCINIQGNMLLVWSKEKAQAQKAIYRRSHVTYSIAKARVEGRIMGVKSNRREDEIAERRATSCPIRQAYLL